MGSFNIKNVNIFKVIITILISSIIMATSSFSVYSMVAKPRFYAYFMELGAKYLEDGKYAEAIPEFTKAIKIEGKSTQARVGAAKGYIGTDDIEKAVILLKEAQDIDIENTDLLREIIEILRDIDPDTAYEMLMKYVDHIGKDNIPSSIRRLLESANESPQIPIISPMPGKYIKPISVKLESDKVRIGHAFYYTEDDSMPDKKSKQYRSPIFIEESTTINIIGYNPKEETTELLSLQYIIDNELKVNIENIISKCQEVLDNTKVGTEVGNCIEGAKEEFAPVIEEARDLMQQPIISYENASIMYDELNNALYNFEQKIIVPTDRTALDNEIEKALQLFDSATEGPQVGQYREGAKSKLKGVIDSAIETLNNLIARQEEIDAMKEKLTNAIDSFNARKITEIDIIISEAGGKTGPVTVSLLWSSRDDLDLHVKSPEGDVVYYGNRRSRSGGELDVDRQVNTFVSKPVENIFWNNPPSGSYTVMVNVYSKRSSGNIPFQVRVVIDGEAKIYDMNADNGAVEVCKFTY